MACQFNFWGVFNRRIGAEQKLDRYQVFMMIFLKNSFYSWV